MIDPSEPSQAHAFLQGIQHRARDGRRKAAIWAGVYGVYAGLREMNRPGPGVPAQKFARGASSDVVRLVAFWGLMIGIIWFLAVSPESTLKTEHLAKASLALVIRG